MNITDHPRFKWLPGMLTTTGRRVLSVYLKDDGDESSTHITSASADPTVFHPVSSVPVKEFNRYHGTPDVDDAATVGCIISIGCGPTAVAP